MDVAVSDRIALRWSRQQSASVEVIIPSFVLRLASMPPIKNTDTNALFRTTHNAKLKLSTCPDAGVLDVRFARLRSLDGVLQRGRLRRVSRGPFGFSSLNPPNRCARRLEVEAGSGPEVGPQRGAQRGQAILGPSLGDSRRFDRD